MIKRRGKSQIEYLDHKPFESKGQTSSNWGVLYIVEKIFLGAIRYFPCIFKKRLDLRKIWASKVLKQQKSQFWDYHLGISRKIDIWM
jgi:hypothetical protein